MRKILLPLLSVLYIASVAHADFTPGYYDRLDGKSREGLKSAAKQCVQDHRRLEYYDLPDYWQYSDVYPDLVDGCKRWWDMYSDAQYLIRAGQSGKASFSANKMQREHSVPKSWWKLNGDVEYTAAYSDMWNLYPSDAAANQAKLNYPFGITSRPTFDNGVTRVGAAQTGYGGGSAYVFEPGAEYKGDFARTIFYMATVYDDINWVINYMFQKNSWPTLRDWSVDMLLDWARHDPVSQKEIDRNNIVEQYQGNRNPFIDFPELAEYIWGTRTSEVFRLADQPGIDPTPPVTGDPEITQPVNGENLDFGVTAVGTEVHRALQIAGHNLTESLSVRVVGTDKNLFSPEVTAIPAATMNQNLGYLLDIAYTPTSVGIHEARITLYDGGLDHSIAVTLRGEAQERPVLTTVRAVEPTDLTAEGYTANWLSVDGIADYYVVTRVRMTGDDQEVETYETGETSYAFTGRESGVAETYYVQYSRLGLMSEPGNAVYVAADSGTEDLPEQSPIRILMFEGGFMVQCDGARMGLRVYDMQGRLLLAPDVVTDGDTFTLPAGIYLITAPGVRLKWQAE